MNLRESLSVSINRQIANQPIDLRNAASRLVEKKFGQIDHRIVAFVHGQDVEIPTTIIANGASFNMPFRIQQERERDIRQNQMDLADAVAHTPNYRLVEAINCTRDENETSQQANERVAQEITRLFELLNLSTQAHTEDVRSQTAKALPQKPQQVFDLILEKSLRLDESELSSQLRLSLALVKSQVVERYPLMTDEKVNWTTKNLQLAIDQNLTQKFADKVNYTLSLYKQPWKADWGIGTYDFLLKASQDIFGADFSMPENVNQLILDQITPTIRADFSNLAWQALNRLQKYAVYAAYLKQNMGIDMPQSAIKAVFEPIKSSIDSYGSTGRRKEWKANQRSDMAQMLKDTGVNVFGDKPELLEKFLRKLNPYLKIRATT